MSAKNLTEQLMPLLDKKTPPDVQSDGAGNYLDEPYPQPYYSTPSGESQALFKIFTPITTYKPPPEFPCLDLCLLTPAVCDFILAASQMIQAPVDLVGSCTLGVLEIACRGRYPVCLPSGHRERPCFYFFPIAYPSERKSGVISAVTRPIIDYEIEYNAERSGDVAQSKSELKILQSRIINAEQAVAKSKNSDDRLLAVNELQELNNELVEFKTVELLRLFGADVTPEKLSAMIKAQDEVFALVSAEGGGLLENIGRYCDKGGMEIYLNGYSGDRVCVDRKNSESVVIDCPTLNIIAPCQPSVITDLFSDKQKSGRGLLSRMLFVKCNSRVGSRKATSNHIDDRIYAKYNNLCRDMLSASSKGDLRFDEGGFAVYTSFFYEIEPQLTPYVGELSFMADWAGKLHGNMIRLAGLIHCISAFEKGRDPCESFITADEARAAVILARYFLAHAMAVYTEQAEPREISNARYLWEIIRSAESISKRDLSRKTHGKQKFYLDESLTELVERGYIRVETIQTGGRPTENIIINPEAKQ